MTTIFTDDFCDSDVDIDLGEETCGYVGRELIFSTDCQREFRVRLTKYQLNELVDMLIINGYSGFV